MEVKFKKAEIKHLHNGDYELIITVPKTHGGDVEKFREKFKEGQIWKADIKRHTEKRSLDANSYCWVLIRKIARHLVETNRGTKTPTENEIYRHHVHELGIYEPLPIKAEAVAKFSDVWSEKGIGWFIEVVDDSKLPGYKRVHAYYGSSTYDSKEMARLIDNLVQDCKALGIETLSPNDLARLKEEWK